MEKQVMQDLIQRLMTVADVYVMSPAGGFFGVYGRSKLDKFEKEQCDIVLHPPQCQTNSIQQCSAAIPTWAIGLVR